MLFRFSASWDEFIKDVGSQKLTELCFGSQLVGLVFTVNPVENIKE